HRLFGYWSAVFDKLEPDLLLMPTAPHVTYDYIAYVLARRRGIPIILFEYVTLAGMLVAMDGFEDGVPQIMEGYRQLRASNPAEPIVLSDRMEEHWRALKGSYENAKPPGLRQVQAGAADFIKRCAEQEEHDAREHRRLEDYEKKKHESF